MHVQFSLLKKFLALPLLVNYMACLLFCVLFIHVYSFRLYKLFQIHGIV